MKVIIDERISLIEANSEDSSYPVENLLDRHPKKVWRAAPLVNRTKIIITTALGVKALALVNTNAVSIAVSKFSGEPLIWNSVWSYGGSTMVWDGFYYLGILGALVDTTVGDVWVEFEEAQDNSALEIILESPEGTTLEAGVISAGVMTTLPCPDYGVSESLLDHSISQELSNGSFYYRKRNTVRNYSLTTIMDRDTDGLMVMRTIGMKLGQKPLMWRLTSLENSQWIVYGRLSSVSQTHDSPRFSKVSMDIMEVV